jgi:hypothetical protein
MRPMISGVFAAIAVLAAGAAPALACGGYQGACSPCGEAYVSPCAPPVYSACDGGCWAHERLPDPVVRYYANPVQQYYYVNQGPTYTGPGDFAPYPTYQEGSVSGWDGYRHRHYYYGYERGRYADAISHHHGPVVYSYRPHRQFRPWRRHAGRYYGSHQRVLRRYF